MVEIDNAGLDDEVMAIAHRAMRGWFQCHWKKEETALWRKHSLPWIRDCCDQKVPYFLTLVILIANKITIEQVGRMIPRELRISLAREGISVEDIRFLNAITLVEFLDKVTEFREARTKMTIAQQNQISFVFMREWVNSLVVVSQKAMPPKKFLSVCKIGDVEEIDALKLFSAIVNYH